MAGLANLRKKKENELISRGYKKGRRAGQSKEKRKKNGLVGAKNRGQGGPI